MCVLDLSVDLIKSLVFGMVMFGDGDEEHEGIVGRIYKIFLLH